MSISFETANHVISMSGKWVNFIHHDNFSREKGTNFDECPLLGQIAKFIKLVHIQYNTFWLLGPLIE